MKTLYSLLFLLPFTAFAQVNHITNGGFESYNTCPTGPSNVQYCNNWYNYTTATPDYFNACAATTTGQSVPNNFEGTQNAAHGSAYIGMLTYSNAMVNPDYREYVASSILPLQKGGRYNVSFSVSLTDNSWSATYAPSIYFFDNGPTTVSTSQNLTVTPQLNFVSTGLITDMTNWTRLSAIYVPDSNYDNIVIGNFSNDASTTLQPIFVNNGYSYYYIDSIVIKLVPRIQITQTDTLICAGDSIIANYTVEAGAPFTSSTVFTLELSNSSGSFTSPTVIGSIPGTTTSGVIKGLIPYSLAAGTGYRLRIKASNPFDETVASSKNITIKKTSITASSNSPVCQHSTLNLTASFIFGATYSWSGPAGFSSSLQNPSVGSVQPVHAGTYSVTATASGCTSAPQTVVVAVIPAPGVKAYISPNDTICQGSSATFVAFPTTTTTVAYQWHLNYVPVPSAISSVYTPSTLSSGDKVHCTITASGSCSGSGAGTSTDTFTMTVLPIVTVPQVTITADPGFNVNPSTMVTFTANVQHGGTNPKYQWYKNGAIQTGAVYSTWTTAGLSYMDMIHVDIFSDDPCAQNKNASDTVYMQFPAGIKDEKNNNINIYPNPSNGSFVISGITANTVATEIINAIGQVVYKTELKSENGTIRINVALAQGIYLLKLQSEGKSQLLKLSIDTNR